MEAIFLKGDDALSRLQRLEDQIAPFGEFLSAQLSSDYLALYSRDAQRLHTMPPLGVVKPYSMDCIPTILSICAELSVPVTSRCGGTGANGACLPAQGGIVLLMGHLRRILDFSQEDRCCTVEAGMTAGRLQRWLEPFDLSFPSTMVSREAAGFGASVATGALQRQYYQGKSAIDFIDEVRIETSNRGASWVSPYQVAGAEGSNGIITALKLKLCRKPERDFWSSSHIDLKELVHLPSTPTLSEAIYQDGQLYLHFQGERWRLDTHPCAEVWPPPSLWERKKARTLHTVVGSALPSSRLHAATERLEDLCRGHGLDLEWRYNILAGEIEFLLQCVEELPDFRLRIKSFLEHWTNALVAFKGSICSGYGLGQLLSPYLPAFHSESSIGWLAGQRDPLLGTANQHPIVGRCVEKELVQ
ncbi:MAG: FAD-binding oxidoreductase [Chlamydiia bacterium]|nr:FAD-binding oxidoreductase [Chlamydiia bacterium]